MITFKKNTLGVIEENLPFLKEELIDIFEKDIISAQDMHENEDASDILRNYHCCLDKNWKEIIYSKKELINFSGGFPILAGQNTNLLLSKTAFIHAALAQTICEFNDSRWLSEAQVNKYNLTAKKDAQPILVLWKRHVDENNLELVYTKLYNVEDLNSENLKRLEPIQNSKIELDDVLHELAEEYDKTVEIRTYIVENGEIFRNEGYLEGIYDDYKIRIPDPSDEFNICAQQAILISLMCFLCRVKLKRDIDICNSLGYFVGTLLANQMMPFPKYLGSSYHKKKIIDNISNFVDLVDELVKIICSEIFEIKEFFDLQIINDKSLIKWLRFENNISSIRKKIEFKVSSDDDQSEIIKRIRRNNLDIKDLFIENLKLRLKQSSISILDYLPNHVIQIQSQLERIMTERDINLFPDNYDFYLKIESQLLNIIVDELKKAENLGLLWHKFESEILESNLPEPKKDYIIKIRATEYKKFLKYILFSGISYESMYQMAEKILRLE